MAEVEGFLELSAVSASSAGDRVGRELVYDRGGEFHQAVRRFRGRRRPQLLHWQGRDLRVHEDAEEPTERDNDLDEGKTKKKAKLDEVAEVRGQRKLDMKSLDRVRRLFRFSEEHLPPVLSGKGKEADEGWCREGRGNLPLTVCRPPHVIVSETRNFAVYSDKFIVVPPRQIGIVSVDGNKQLLKALALYLSSDFALYHQFFTATHFGVQRAIASLSALRQIPIPLLALSPAELARWEALHDRLAATQPRLLPDSNQPDPKLDESLADDGQEAMIEELNRSRVRCTRAGRSRSCAGA